MGIPQPARVPFDAVRYARRSREGPCFVCAILAGHPDYPHHDVYEDAATIAFLTRQPTLLGYCIVAPKRHVEDWVGGLGEEEYLALQRVVHRVAGAVAKVVPAERLRAAVSRRATAPAAAVAVCLSAGIYCDSASELGLVTKPVVR